MPRQTPATLSSCLTTSCLDLASPSRPHLSPPASFVIKKTEQRYRELAELGIAVTLICVGRKGSVYFKRRPQYKIEGEWQLGSAAVQQVLLWFGQPD